MDIRRVVLYTALALVIYSLWTKWQSDVPQPMVVTNNAVVTNTNNPELLPIVTTTNNDPMVERQETPNTPELTPSIHVQTDVFNITVDLKQGDIIGAQLLDYPVSVNEKNTPFSLLHQKAMERYVANSSLFVVNNHQVQNTVQTFHAEKQQYTLLPNQTTLTVRLNGTTTDGLQLTKTLVFKRGSYLIDVNYSIVNQGTSPWHGYMNTQLLRTSPPEDKSSLFHVGSFTGASYAHPGVHRYQKINFSDMTKSNLDIDVTGGWIAMQQHYFLTAWIPSPEKTEKFYTRALNNSYTIGAVSKAIMIEPNQHQSIGSRLYLGPEITSVLKTIAPGLDLTVDYGFLWFISSLLFSLMKTIYSVVGNWGWSIVLVTVFIKLAFYRLSATSYKSMANMRKLQPKLVALRERYGEDKAKISQATMELYRQEKVNPLGGCLPILIQIPVFIALYWVLLESVALRQAPFMLWINDLAAADPYHVLPLIMGATMLIQQRLNPAPPDPVQAKMMMFLPVLFTGLFWSFPAGLVLYWIVNNTLSILQQWYITKKYSEMPVKKKRITVK